MSSILPSINRNNYNAPSLDEATNQEPLHKSEHKSEYSPSSFVPLPKGTPSQKSQLTSSLDPLFSNSNNGGSEITLSNHKIVPLKTSSTLGKLPSITGKTEGSTEGKVAKYNSSLQETDPYAIFNITNSDILKIIDPTIDTSNEKHAGRKARAKLDQCIELDPTILDSSGPELRSKVRNALAQLPGAKPSSLPPNDSLIEQPVGFSAAPKSKNISSSKTRDTSWARFSINRNDFKTVDPSLDYSKRYSSIRSSVKKARAKLNKCIDIDPTIILEDHGPLRENKIRNAMEILARAKPPSSSLPPIKT